MDNGDLSRFANKVDRLVNQVKRAVALDLYGTLIGPPPEGTPVDKAVARGSWHYGVNRQLTDVPERPTSGRLSPPTPEDAGVELNLGDEINITNAVPYIVPLNEGHSSQSPAGFVDSAVDATVARFEGVVTKVKAGEG